MNMCTRGIKKWHSICLKFDKEEVMGRRKTKKQNLSVVKNESNIMSQEQMIEMHAEAYYRALKRIEDEKSKDDKQKSGKGKYKWYEEILFGLNIFLWPWKINKRFSINNRIYDSIPVLFVLGVLRFVGGLMWLIGLVGFVTLVMCRVTNDILNTIAISFVLLSFGSIFILAGGEFEKETDSNKIYAYSATIIALVSCIVSIIALLER